MKVVAYCRYSSDNQREESIEAQVRAIKEYAERNGLIVTKIYADEAKSATTDKRPEFQNMVKDSEHHQFEAVIVHKLDRFSRDRYDSAHYKRTLKKNGVRLISVLENIDGSPESIMLESILEGMAEYYSKNLAREAMKGLKENAYQCKHTGGVPPLGYDVDYDKKYIINEYEAESVKLIFNMTNEGHGYDTIAMHLNALGKKTKLGTQFKTNSIRDILRNEKYTGIYIFNRRAAGKKGNYVNKADSEIIRIPGGMPIIITKELFDAVNSKIDSRKYGKRLTGKRTYLLTGLIQCGQCGGSYTGQSYRGGRGGAKYYLYGCTKKYNKSGCTNKDIRQDLLEGVVISTVEENLLNANAIDMWSEKVAVLYEQTHDERSNEIPKIESELNSIKEKISSMLDLLLDNTITREQYKDKTAGLNDKQSYLEERLFFLKSIEQKGIKKEDVKRHLLNLKSMLESDDNLQRISVFQSVVQKIIVHEDHVDIFLIVDNAERGNFGGDEGQLTLPLSISKSQIHTHSI